MLDRASRSWPTFEGRFGPGFLRGKGVLLSIPRGYPLGYHEAIWHPRARIQDIIKIYTPLDI
jgi:hypothetical protein